MKKFLKDLGIYIVVFTTIAGGIWFIRDFQQNSLEGALDLMGEKLAEMVTDSDGRDRFAAAFENFIKRVLNDEVSPEQVETVAANIINLSNKDVKLSPDEAETILTSPAITEDIFSESKFAGIKAPELKVAVAGSLITTTAFDLARAEAFNSNFKKPASKIPHHAWQEVGERLNVIFKTNEDLQKFSQKNAPHHPEVNYLVRRDDKNGMCIIIADKPTRKKEDRDIRAKLQTIKGPEGEQLIVWEKNFSRILHNQRRRVMQEMKVLHKRLASQPMDSAIAHARERKRWMKIARAKALEAMAFDVNVDSMINIATEAIESVEPAKQH